MESVRRMLHLEKDWVDLHAVWAVLYQMQTVSPLAALHVYVLPVVQLFETSKPPFTHPPFGPSPRPNEKPMVKDSDSVLPTEHDGAVPQLMVS